MFGPYRAKAGGQIAYIGNKIRKPISNVRTYKIDASALEKRVEDLNTNPMWMHISKINHTINFTTNKYFEELGAYFTPLPLTTRMISSPGAVYGKYKLNYTTDTVPIKLKWFDLPKEAFLAESSQIYLELALLQPGIDHVFANYNSFRKEPADATHLSEFHHIEYEGHVQQEKNLEIAWGLTKSVLMDILKNNQKSLEFFLDDEDFAKVKDLSKLTAVPKITFEQALDYLYRATKDKTYTKFSMQNFGSWEEIKVTELVDGIVAICEMPLFEVPFYHAPLKKNGRDLADNADIIWPGHREFIGSGHRVRNLAELEEKAIAFNLPRNDYVPYLQSRERPNYQETSGFGLGWERLLQGLLKMPTIDSVTHFPRVHNTLRP